MAHTPTKQRISAHDLADQLAEQRVKVIDVREPMEYAGGHIAGSLNVPLSRIGQADLPRGNRDTPILWLTWKAVFPPGSKQACRCASSRTLPCR